MRIHTHGSPRVRNGRGSSRQSKKNPVAYSIVTLLAFIIAVFAVVNKSIEYSAKAQELAEHMSETSSKIKRLESEATFLKMKAQSQMSHKEIQRNIKKFDLALREPSPNQVRFLNSDTKGYASVSATSGQRVALR